MPPSLRDAERQFSEVLQLAVEAANLQQQLRQGLEAYEQCQ